MGVTSRLGRSIIEGLETYRHERAANTTITHIRGTAFPRTLVAAAEQKTTRIAACQ
jgi:hypothetical protein